MNDTPTVRALLDLEDAAPQALFTKALDTDTLLWPLARWPIASALSSVHLNVTAHTAAAGDPSRLYYLTQMLRGFAPNPWSSDRIQQADHLFFVLGGTKTSATKGVGNWLSDGFAEALGDDAAVVQDLGFDAFTRGSLRPANKRTWTLAPSSARVREHAKKFPLSPAAERHVAGFLQEIYSALEAALPSSRHAGITQTVLGRVQRLSAAEAEFHKLLDRAQPRRLYMEEAAYGGHSNLIRIAHQRGIEVAELQHGWIGASHAAYNYGRAWFDSPLTSSLPDTMFTFGSYWGEDLRFPGRCIPVGKPQLDQAAQRAAPFATRQFRLLIVSSVMEREQLIAATLLLKQLLPAEWNVVIRPHPSERDDAEGLFAKALKAGAVLDQELDAAASVAASRAVVGMVSTVLFEALPMQVHIGVIETSLGSHYADESIFSERLDSEAAFEGFVSNVTSGSPPNPETANTVWHPEAVRTFLAEVTSN